MFKRILTPLLIILLLLSIVVMGAPTYVNIGPTTEFEGDVGVPAGSGYCIDDIELDINWMISGWTLTHLEDTLFFGAFSNIYYVKYGNLEATSAPTVNDDVDLDYMVGSRWIDITNDKEYICLDNTDGAAVWTETTGAGGGATTFLGLTDTPAAYTGQAGKYTKVNAGETALEFGTPAGAGTVTTSGTPVQYDYARFTDATTIEGRSYSEVKTDLGIDLSLYYLKTAIDTQGEMETIWSVSLENETHASEHAVGSADTIFPADPNADRYLMWDDAPTGELVWAEVSGGYTNLTSFVDQTAWRLFYSNADGDVIELVLGVDGTYLGSTGATSAPAFSTPSGAGDMLKATYDTDGDNDIDVAAGGTEKSSWTLYCIPYLSGTTTFGEITVGTAEYALTVNAGATGYDWTLFDLSLYYLKTEVDTQGEMETIWSVTLLNDVVDDTTPELGGELDAGAHSIGFTQQTITYNVTTTTVDWTAGNKATVTLTGNVGTLAFTNPTNPCNVLLKIVQDATGSRLITAYDADVMWVGGTKPTLTTTANAIDICSFYWDGTNYFGVASLAFATP